MPPGAAASNATDPGRRTRLALLLTAVVLALIAIAVNWGGVRGEYIGPDHALYLRSPLTQLPPEVSGGAPPWQLHATTALSLEMGRRIWGGLPAGLRAGNLALHVIATLLLFALSWMMTRRYAESAAAGILFSVHPVHTETLALPGARGEILAAVFCLIALIAYSRRPALLSPAAILAAICLVLAVWSSPLALTVPLLVLAVDIAPGSPVETGSEPQRRNALFPWILLGSILFLGAVWAFDASYATPANRWLGGMAFLTALREILFPFTLHVYHVLGPMAGIGAMSVLALLASLAVLAAVVLIAVRMTRQNRRETGASSVGRWTVVGIGLAVAPLVGLAMFPPPPLGPDVPFSLTDRSLYLPSIGACIVLAVLIGRLVDLAGAATPRLHARATVGAAAAVAVGFAALSAARLPIFRNDVTYWASAIDDRPQSVFARIQLALAAVAHGQAARAIDIARPLLDRTPNDPETHLLMANLHRDARDLESAEKEAREALRLDPRLARAYLVMGLIARERGNAPGARDAYSEAVRLDPKLAEAHSNLGAVLVALGAPDQALKEFRTAVELDPTLSDAAANLAHFLVNQKQPEEALAVLRTAMRYAGANARLSYNLGEVLRRQGDDEGAMRAYADAIRLDPTYARPLNDLAALFAKGKQYDAAIDLLRRLLVLEPDNEQAHYNLGIAYRETGDRSRAAAEFAAALKIGRGTRMRAAR